ncbi:ABC transporter permease subunit [Candidatus Villigracilis proximus]|uniref:ABC transporter permease subunit n=1 Tax=Candidatus Villigracilis proximus TaxID=3140683 RepID=UPI0031E5AE65
MSVFIALTWKYFGFHMLLYLAGLQNIPLDLEEAARIDGANNFQNFFLSPCRCWAVRSVPLSICPCLARSNSSFWSGS